MQLMYALLFQTITVVSAVSVSVLAEYFTEVLFFLFSWSWRIQVTRFE